MMKIPRWLSRSALQSTFEFLNLPYLQKWTIFGIIIGIIAGTGAVGVTLLTGFFTALFLGGGAGFVPPAPGAEQQGAEYAFSIERPWILPAITGLGGLAVGLLFYKIQPKGEGHGTDAVIDAFHNRQGIIPARAPVLTAVASPITIGSGGSGGLEGPMSQIGAGLSSMLARVFKFDADDRRIAVAAGLAAGIGSIFKVPLGAALFSTEVFYRQDFEVKALVPSVIASVVGYTVFSFVFGWDPIFSISQNSAKYSRPESLLLYGIIGIISAAASMAYVRIFHSMSRAFAGLKRVPAYAKPAIGGAAVGAIAVFAPQVLGTSYGWLQLAMLQSPLMMPIWMVLGIVILKIVATSLTVGSGGSAGVFAPTMAIGGLLGAFIGGLFHMLGLFLWIDVSAAAIVGMVAFFCATAKTPIATIIMGSELTGGYGLLAPIMIATVVAYAASSLNSSIFKSQVTTRRESPVHRGEYDNSLLKELRARDAANPRFPRASRRSTVDEALEAMRSFKQDFVLVVIDGAAGSTAGDGNDSDGKRGGEGEDKAQRQGRTGGGAAARIALLRDVMEAKGAGRQELADAGLKEPHVVKDSDSLYDVFNLLMSTEAGIVVAVSSDSGEVTGTISYKDIARAYHDHVHSKTR